MRTRATIKAQDGCDQKCTFCVTTIARGPGRSRSIDQISADIRAAIKGGAKEIVLTGVHLGSWGKDFREGLGVKQLVESVLDISELPRLRLSSLEPWNLDNDFFDLWEDERLCRHLHLPLQSGSGATLRRMARNTTPKKFARLVEAARNQIPELAITTDIIVGFPGESQQEFAESLSFIDEMEFADAHVFSYSERPETAAAKMSDPVPNGLRKERSRIVRENIAQSAEEFRSKFLGAELDVLWESEEALEEGGWMVQGLTDNYLKARAFSTKSVWNEISQAKIISMSENGINASLDAVPQAVWFSN